MPLQFLWCARCNTGFTFTGARVERAAGGKRGVRQSVMAKATPAHEFTPQGMVWLGFSMATLRTSLIAVAIGAGSVAVFESMRVLNVPWFTCIALGVLVLLVSTLVWLTHARTLQIAEHLAKRPADESAFERDQRLGEESERKSEEIIQEFRLFMKLGIRPTDEWRLRAAKEWKIPTPEELDEEQQYSRALNAIFSLSNGTIEICINALQLVSCCVVQHDR
jgi:hypothetical protein